MSWGLVYIRADSSCKFGVNDSRSKVFYQPKDVQESLGLITFTASTKQIHFVLDEAEIRPDPLSECF